MHQRYAGQAGGRCQDGVVRDPVDEAGAQTRRCQPEDEGHQAAGIMAHGELQEAEDRRLREEVEGTVLAEDLRVEVAAAKVVIEREQDIALVVVHLESGGEGVPGKGQGHQDSDNRDSGAHHHPGGDAQPSFPVWMIAHVHMIARAVAQPPQRGPAR